MSALTEDDYFDAFLANQERFDLTYQLLQHIEENFMYLGLPRVTNFSSPTAIHNNVMGVVDKINEFMKFQSEISTIYNYHHDLIWSEQINVPTIYYSADHAHFCRWLACFNHFRKFIFDSLTTTLDNVVPLLSTLYIQLASDNRECISTLIIAYNRTCQFLHDLTKTGLHTKAALRAH